MPMPTSHEAMLRRIDEIALELDQLALMSDDESYPDEREAVLRDELEKLERVLDPDREADRQRSGRRPGD